MMDEREETLARAFRSEEAHQAALDRLAICRREVEQAKRDGANALRALSEARATLESGEARIAALLAENERLQAENKDLLEEITLSARDLAALQAKSAIPEPPVFAVPYARVGVRAVEQVVEAAILPDAITDSKPRPSYTDSEYNAFYPLDVVEYCAWWRANLMPPAKEEASDCDDRAVAFRSDLHRWSGFTLQVGIGLGTFAWALRDGQPFPHYVALIVAPDARLWVLDPAFLDRPELWTPERAKLQSVPLY